MNIQGYPSIPKVLCDWTTFLVKALPLRSVGTFVELLYGSMLSSSGFVSEAYLALDMVRHWNSYYKWLQQGRWSWLSLARRFVVLVLSQQKAACIDLIIDDSLVLRHSKRAPASRIHYQHGNKPNLAKYVRGQCWVSLASAMSRQDGTVVAVPLLQRLCPTVGNTGKLNAALVLLRAVKAQISQRMVRVLVDSWYMKRRFVGGAVQAGYTVIGQVRKDTALYRTPKRSQRPGRGRPRKYGDKITFATVKAWRCERVKMILYGREQNVVYRSAIVKIRFLKGHTGRAVWCEFEDAQTGQRKKICLLIATDPTLSAQEILQIYARRWSIEPMFHALKNRWGLNEAWQQTRTVLHRWAHITAIGYGLIQLLTLHNTKEIRCLANHSPWRLDNVLTAGKIRLGLQRNLMHVRIRDLWDRKCQKFQPQKYFDHDKGLEKIPKAA